MNDKKYSGLNCPIPISDYPHVLLAHGGGGRLMHQLIDKIFAATFANPHLETAHDGAVLKIKGNRLAFTTDSYVVDPLFFPGGDIGKLAIDGTVNDLAMCGARPLYLSAGFIIEEGFSMDSLWRVALSMREAADQAAVSIVTGDTKVVDKGRGHGLFINTAGVGVIEHELTIAPSSVRPGDVVIINGDIGRHGMAIMARREGLAFETTIESDCAPLAATVLKLLDRGINIHCLRDLTRGGLAASLVEIASTSSCRIEVEENKIPVCDQVRGACEILGFDPIYVANEGRMVIFVPDKDADKVMDILHEESLWPEAAIIGKVSGKNDGIVTMKSIIGADRIIDMLSGEQLPRIC
ncbi:MAG: hydrogenase expression/formation protein HypE [candidate division Zixibacteria bacterium HGW-Zixibacteria-1]|nr:MAG: hydrogenase expression/formation protein HypE [candidate division Zixibacteria bacterium HGW-Zixibacteria-1]